jgi:hypothetical protein
MCAFRASVCAASPERVKDRRDPSGQAGVCAAPRLDPSPAQPRRKPCLRQPSRASCSPTDLGRRLMFQRSPSSSRSCRAAEPRWPTTPSPARSRPTVTQRPPRSRSGWTPKSSASCATRPACRSPQPRHTDPAERLSAVADGPEHTGRAGRMSRLARRPRSIELAQLVPRRTKFSPETRPWRQDRPVLIGAGIRSADEE